ncbi:helix-turn-helix transcriptional regulator [Bifidobacterium phasiani]|uniref:helix-turn-helix transcriptional regulator n=1 Tax=Bifidobacterium phasiani TaxID=2834431 RepID=UPI003B839C47
MSRRGGHVDGRVDNGPERKLYYSRSETARMLGVSVSTLDRMRHDGRGPVPTVFGPRTIRYAAGDIIRWQRTNGGAR